MSETIRTRAEGYMIAILKLTGLNAYTFRRNTDITIFKDASTNSYQFTYSYYCSYTLEALRFQVTSSVVLTAMQKIAFINDYNYYMNPSKEEKKDGNEISGTMQESSRTEADKE